MKLHYRVQVRDKENKMYVDKRTKRKVDAFEFEEDDLGEAMTELVCAHSFYQYSAITGSDNRNS